MGPTELRYCACGATRSVPAGLRIVSCVRCGRALTVEPDAPAPPTSGIALAAGVASQLLGVLAFVVVVSWAWTVHPDRGTAVALVAAAVFWVFAGGGALRGSLPSLACCALLDVALAVFTLANGSGARAFVLVSTSRTAPVIAPHVDTALAVAGSVASLVALACLVAIPHVRRLGAWEQAQIARVA